MALRAEIARKTAAANPLGVDLDDQFLPWIWYEEDKVWLSFDGNYSATSPEEKRQARKKFSADPQERQAYYQEKIDREFILVQTWSRIRQEVLERDNHQCQLCKKIKTEPRGLHIHHILKRDHGGTDHFDNLITVCPSCHIKADRKLYNPNWEKMPE